MSAVATTVFEMDAMGKTVSGSTGCGLSIKPRPAPSENEVRVPSRRVQVAARFPSSARWPVVESPSDPSKGLTGFWMILILQAVMLPSPMHQEFTQYLYPNMSWQSCFAFAGI